MSDALLVQVVECADQLCEDLARFSLVHLSVGLTLEESMS